MSPLAIVLSASLALASDVDRGEVLKSYEVAKAKAGRDAASQVRLALWCEAHGLDAQKVRHLAVAILTDPANATARGLLGLVEHRGKWVKPESVPRADDTDPALAAKLAEYDRRRGPMEEKFRRRLDWIKPRPSGETVRARELAAWRDARRSWAVEYAYEHSKLGVWCESNGLKEQAEAHFRQAVLLDPHRGATWKHLGYVSHNGRWMTREQVAAEAKEAEAQKHADARWAPLLRTWRGWLGLDNKRDEAQRLLDGVTDPRAVPAILAVFGRGAADQYVAVEILGRIDGPRAAEALASLAVSGASDAVRKAATGALKTRSFRDYAGRLVDSIRTPIRYRVLREVGGPGMPGALEVETPRFKMLRTYDAPPAFNLNASFYGYVGIDPNGLPVVARGIELSRMGRENAVRREADLEQIEARTAMMIADANLKAYVSQQRMAADLAEIGAFNAATGKNAQIAEVLSEAAAAPLLPPDDEDAWHRWYYDKAGYSYDVTPQVILAVNASPQMGSPSVYSCFTADTPVRARGGHRPISTLLVGDEVLSQDETTGALSFRTITAVHRNPPGPIFEVSLDNGEALHPSVYHRFWLAGRGWALARELKPGDAIRTLGGLAKVVSVSSLADEPLFNLDVAGTRTFFVGERDALVHDNTPPDPHLKPFDAANP